MAPLIDLTGQQFGRLTVICRTPRPPRRKSGHATWLCQCVCGNRATVASSSLRCGVTQSCGCLQSERARESNKARTNHGHRVGWGATREYRTWHTMKSRCQNPNATGFERYGGRGITVCERWQIFENFIADMGSRPADASLDRIDTDGHYEPNNCRWATPREQRHNRRPRIIAKVGDCP